MSRLVGGRYEVGEEIGRGGMATVHRAYDTRLGRSVAVKMLHAGRLGDRTFQGRFRREAQSAASLSHPNIVAVFDSGEDVVTSTTGITEVVPFIVMELVEGHTLSQLMHDDGPFEPDKAMRVVEQVLAGLGYSHERGLVHRDVKPGNVMLTPDGEVKVMDFGIARGGGDSTATMTQTQAVIGTAQYLSPEQARGQEVDGRSDLYSTGCLLFELVTGRPPFTGDSPLAIAYQHVGEDPSLPSSHRHDIPRALDMVIMHALVKDRERRYQSADDFRRDLQAARTGRPLSEAARLTGEALFTPTESIHRADGTGPATGAGSAVGAAAAAAGAAGAAAGAAGAAAAAVDPTTPTPQGASVAPTPPVGASAVAAPADGIRPDGPGPQGHHTSTQPPVDDGSGRRYVAWITVLLLLIGLVGFGVWRLTRPAPVVYKTVPQLVGEGEGTARSKLASAGLTGSFHPKTSNKPKGSIIEQDPAAGSRQDVTKAVLVIVSTGPTSVAVPDVTRYTASSARQRLLNASLAPGDVVEIDDKAIPQGQVVRTDPPVGQTVSVNTRVTIYVSSGKTPVPDVTGQDWAAATKTLTDAGFRVAREDVPSDQTPGTVLGQDVAKGSQPPGTKITLKVAVVRPTPTITVTTTATATQTVTPVPPAPTSEAPTPQPGPTSTAAPTPTPTTATPAPSPTSTPTP